MRSSPVVSGQSGTSGQYNGLRTDAKVAAAFLPHNQLGTLALSVNPTNTKTVTLVINGNSVVFTFVSSIGSTPGNVLIGADAPTSMANLLALLNNPGFTTTKGIALSVANQQYVQFLDYAVVTTNMVISSYNNSVQQNMTSFSASTTVTSGTWTSNTLALYIEPGLFYVGTTQVNFLGGSTSTFSAPAANPRIDIVTVDNAGTIAVSTGAEAGSPTAPAYPATKLVVCEVYHRVGETKILDYDDGVNGYIYKDARSSVGFLFLNDPAQINFSLVPVAMITPYGGNAAPTGWLLCDGTSYLRTDYAALFTAIGTTYGSVDGTHFTVPDLRGRVPVGAGTGTGGGASGTGAPTGGSALTAVAVGTWKGEETHTLTASEIPSHTHTVGVANATGGGGSAAASTNTSQTATVTTDGGSGGGTSHNNIQPVVGVSYIIKT